MTDYTATHPHYLFVYGTLKKPFGNHQVLTTHGAHFISDARTMESAFTLTENFPFVYKPYFAAEREYYRPNMGKIVGELYKVSDAGLEACDRLEGHPHAYCRTPTTVEFGTAAIPQRVTAGLYLYHSGAAHEDLLKPRDGLLEWGVERNLRLERSHPQFQRRKA